jgi:hypothetical protein
VGGKYVSIVRWQSVYLEDNPFVSTPPTPTEEVIWAGVPDQKKRIEDRITSSLKTSPYTLVLNWGPWGSGKTHAARYFNQQAELKRLGELAGVGPPLSLVLDLPRGERDIIRGIYLVIMGRLGLRQIGRDLSEVAEKLGEDRFRDLAYTFVRDEEFAEALAQLAGIVPLDGQLSLGGSGPSPALRRYFLLSAGTPDLRDLGLARKLDSNNDMFEMLTAIFNLLFYSGAGVEPRYSELILWFDEMEEIVSLPGKEQRLLTSLLRDFTDYVPSNLTMFVNFTLRSGGQLEDIGAYLTDAVWSRVRDEIYFGELDEEGIIEYVRDLLNAPKYRSATLAKECPDELYPFTKEALQFVGQRLMPNATPRYVNEACSLLIERALATEALDSQNARIDLGFAQEHEREIGPIMSKGRSLR